MDDRQDIPMGEEPVAGQAAPAPDEAVMPQETAREIVEEAGAHRAGAPGGAEESDAEVEPDGDLEPEDAADAGEAEGAAAVEHDIEALLAKARERDEYLALAQRTQADFENYRRRMAREIAAASDKGVAKLAKELLPALDHLELALQAAEQGGSNPEMVKGIRLVQDELARSLAKVGIEAFAPVGEAFDPTEHEAMAQAPFEGAESGSVAQVYQQGYRLNGSVLRPARVVVAQ